MQNYIRAPLSYLFVTLLSFIFIFFRLGPLSLIKAHINHFSHLLLKKYIILFFKKNIFIKNKKNLK